MGNFIFTLELPINIFFYLFAGQKFAMLEIQTLVTYILLNFELIPITKVEDVILITDLTLRSQEPVKIKFNQRHK